MLNNLDIVATANSEKSYELGRTHMTALGKGNRSSNHLDSRGPDKWTESKMILEIATGRERCSKCCSRGPKKI